jgi:hypothetical protein
VAQESDAAVEVSGESGELIAESRLLRVVS